MTGVCVGLAFAFVSGFQIGLLYGRKKNQTHDDQTLNLRCLKQRAKGEAKGEPEPK